MKRGSMLFCLGKSRTVRKTAEYCTSTSAQRKKGKNGKRPNRFWEIRPIGISNSLPIAAHDYPPKAPQRAVRP